MQRVHMEYCTRTTVYAPSCAFYSLLGVSAYTPLHVRDLSIKTLRTLWKSRPCDRSRLEHDYVAIPCGFYTFSFAHHVRHTPLARSKSQERYMFAFSHSSYENLIGT
ncbi:hypothetical protein OBBRIDRAFT_128364 [Obba rivulosa]|uniref:Uncharacterized protein n=1 Tax=Obba rivulosa TaxID=1052685 RepID=A0A8E2DID4_9APHY|nr:hypothetical protein OBBRIDRAFT_128364 [Obba rivulosa]